MTESKEVKHMKNSKEYTPVKIGERFNVRIEGIGQKGDGVAKIDGYVIFVEPPVELGEDCTIQITNKLPKFGFGKKVD